MSEEYSRLVGNIALREIINSLKSGEKTVNAIAEDLKKVSPSGITPLAIELYLWLLQQKGYVQAKGSGPNATYTITDKWKELESKAAK